MLTFREAELKDVPALLRLERAVFSTPWSEEAFLAELATNQYAHYILALKDGKVIGYAGIWLVLDEGHITNVAIHPEHQGHHHGEALMRELIRIAFEHGAVHLTLEVRVTNTIAQNLYRKLKFQDGALRKNYYPDNQEDALVMWVDLS
ncbi:ribosomal-protein-alanine acetyltransferase [Listeria floridensis FSL S10-1187]|uniref:[Ribosomal protein bS18]-alanine N-acetyltransferase n=1 Tax=Listeria floridensis FSL S10-1187 TaxID=1265817 RepID=A0ABN0RCU1_9LIST|nr:ribosomal protein S18-alanine N-acetyltransferase [Listeria floridensis]EUJ28203.1 ribosomal-protein-alanine acetyltransferase [Listeria floridensis FSL S10-1187]